MMVVWLLALGLAGAAPRAGPAVEARLDTDRVTVGDPFHLELGLRFGRGEKPVLPALAALLPDFAVRPEAAPEPVISGGEVAQVFRYELRLYQLGEHPIPPLEIGFVEEGGDTLIRATPALEVEVVRVRQEGDEELRDIAPPVEVPGGLPAWLVGVLAALAALGLAGGIYWWLNRRRPAVESPPPPPKDYLAEFARIAAMGLLERGGLKIYYSLLSETLRRFLEERVGIEAMERTTAEIVQTLAASRLERPLIREIERFLGVADLVKFARFAPPLETARQVPEEGKAIVRRVLEFKAEQERQAEEARQALERQAAPT